LATAKVSLISGDFDFDLSPLREQAESYMIGLLLTLIVVGVVLYLVNTMIPMDANIKTIINVLVILLVLVWVLSAFGVFSSGALNAPLPRVR
jgi:hypothetical protein